MLSKVLKLATSPMYYHASIIPETAVSESMLTVLDKVANFLRDMRVDYLSTCASPFLPRHFRAILNLWFEKRGATGQVVYYQAIKTRNTTFEEIWKRKFKKRNREEIRKAEREGVRVIKIDSAEGMAQWKAGIHQCNVSALIRQGRWGAYPESYMNVYSAELISTKNLLKEHFNVYGVIYERSMIAYATIHEFKGLMALTNIASHTRFFAKHPNDILIAHLLKEACDRGFDWFEYGFDRVKRDGKIPSLYPGLQAFRRKFGFEEVPARFYRLGLSRRGRILQNLYSGREYIVVQSAHIPESIRNSLLKLYHLRRREAFIFSHV